MRKIINLFFVLMICQVTYGQKKAMRLVWSDEFNYTGLPDKNKWNYDTIGNTYGWGNDESQWYTYVNSNNAFVQNGILTISSLLQDYMGKKYTSARLTTKNKGDWKYGRIEVRAKLPKGRGTWPAIWMFPTHSKYGDWPKSGEIDIMEQVGSDPDTILSTSHTEFYNHQINTQKGAKYYLPTSFTSFHVYSLEWNKNEWKTYVDNSLCFTFKNEKIGSGAWPYDQPFHLILNLAIGGGLGGQKGIDDKLFPHKFQIDYVRVYQ